MSLVLSFLCAAAPAFSAAVESVPTVAAPIAGAVAAPVAPAVLGAAAFAGGLSAPTLSAPASATSVLAAPAAAEAAAVPAPALDAAASAAAPAAEAAPAPAAAAPANVPVAVVAAAAPALRSFAAPAADPAQPAMGAHVFDGADDRAGAAAAAEPFAASVDILRAERPTFTKAEKKRVGETDAALTAAVREAVAEVLGKKVKADTISRGSTSRGTYSTFDPDYDLSVVLPQTWSAAEFSRFIDERSDDVKAALERSAERAGSRLFPGEDVTVSVDGPISLTHTATDAETRGTSVGVELFHLRVSGEGRGRYAKADVTFTNSRTFANPYPQFFADQLAQVEAREGKAGVERLLSDIRLAKEFFKESVGAYKFYEGGPSAVGIEQLVMQSGRVSDADQGRTILETGSFDKMAARLSAAGYDEHGTLRTFEGFQAAWNVHNPFMAPANFLSLMGRSWRRAAAAARTYEEAKLAGRPIALRDLSVRRTDFIGRPAPAQSLVVRLALHGSRKSADKIYARLKRGFDSSYRFTRERAGKSAMTITIDVPARLDIEAVAKRVAVLFRSWENTARIVAISYPGSDDAADVMAAAPARAAAPASEPVAASAATPVRRASAVDRSAPGALTLGMLERFATQGPRPLDRGDEYLYAQGAKTLPAGFEAAWAERVARPLPSGKGVERARVLLMRRQDRTYVMMPSVGQDGEAISKPLNVDPSLAQGVVSDSLVEIAYTGTRVLGVRPIGSYPQDMMVGRAARRGGAFVLEGLFRDGGRPTSLYAPLVLKDGVAVQDGQIVQAFVRPNGDGYEAVPMLDLGRDITPEIAAREIALRRGARGYFDEAVVRQAESEGRAEDSAGDYARIKAELERQGKKEHVEDLRELSFVTIDPPGAGDLDDAFHVVKEADGGYTWLLATSDVAHYVRPGTPAFRAAARIGNTFYSIDKDGIGEYPMNHPVISKHLASLLDGKDSIAMITRMRFDRDGKFLLEKSDTFLGLVHVKGRYTYNQVAEMWKDGGAHGIAHPDQVTLARELAGKLTRADGRRGKMDLRIDQVENVKKDGVWGQQIEVEDPLLNESHHLIEELKVYGNRVIATRLTGISRDAGVPHISRVHPEQNEGVTRRLLQNLQEIGVPWKSGSLADFLESVQTRQDLSPEKKQVAQWLVLTSRQSAKYAADDAEGHEGLALEAGAYDHPSAPIRRFSDMYNRTLLETSLEGADPKVVYAAIIKDLKSMGFSSLEDYLKHLNGREQATRQMDYEVDAFMSLVELAKPENAGRTFAGYVRMARAGRNPSATIQLEGSAATVVLSGPEAAKYKLLQHVDVTVRGVDLAARKLDAAVAPAQPGRRTAAAGATATKTTPAPAAPVAPTQTAPRPRTSMADAIAAAAAKNPQVLRGWSIPAESAAEVGLEAAGFVKNDEGVWVGGRSALQYHEIRRLYDKLSPLMDLSDTMNVMDDAFDEARVKLAAVEKAAADRDVAQSSVHLEETRTFVDAVLEGADGKVIAEHTHRVYFHPADNADSEIAEGIRRVDSYLEEAKEDFKKGGRAEQDMNRSFDEVLLTFDTRGYHEIADHLRAKEAEFRREFGDRFSFAYVIERPLGKEQLHAEYNRLVDKYKDQPKGVMNILDGVTYSRYVGLLHELKSHEDSVGKGETVLQAGRDFFEELPQPDGSTKRRYITEFDAVVRSADGTIVLREDKSVRIPLPLEKVMETTFLYKLEIYKKNRTLIEKSLGAPLNVRFSVDVGGASRKPARKGVLVWNDPRQEALLDYLKTQGPILSERYGFPVSFVFVNSHAGEPSDLFYRAPVTQEQWEKMAQQGGGSKRRR